VAVVVEVVVACDLRNRGGRDGGERLFGAEPR
jgi:hypothetical protein